MKLIESYLLYLLLQEREWNTPTENPDAFDINLFARVLGKEDDIGEFGKTRHVLQPSMYNIYIKNYLGDYMGRPDTMNSQTTRRIGFKQFLKDLDKIKKRIEFAKKIKNKIPSNFFKSVSGYGETNDPGGDTGDGGDDGGDGGADGGGE